MMTVIAESAYITAALEIVKPALVFVRKKSR
jgi:hypothetical protein